MKKYLVIIALVVTTLPSMGRTGKGSQPLSVEQRQQFTYYWYAARQAITEARYPEAYTYLQFCNMINPADGQTLTFLGVLYQAVGQNELAMEAYRKAFEVAPRDQWFKYSAALLDQRTEESTQEALRVLEKAYKSQKSKVKSQESRVKSQESRVKSQESRAEEELLEQLQRLYVSEQMWKKALAMQDELDKQKGYDAYSALARYRIYAMWDKPKKAIAAIDKYLELDPTDIRFLLFRLDLMERTKAKPKELYAMFDRILALDPHNLGTLNNYAWTLATHGGDLAEAERMSAITIREEPGNPTFLDTYGWILHLKGQDELALFYLQRALQNAEGATAKEVENHIRQIKK